MLGPAPTMPPTESRLRHEATSSRGRLRCRWRWSVAVTPGPTAPRIAIVAIVLSFALAVAVGILRTVNAEPVERAAEVAGNVAFAVVFAAPALLALLGLRGRPSLLVAAGALDLGLAFVTLFSPGEAIGGISVVAAMLGAVWVLSKPPESRARPAAATG